MPRGSVDYSKGLIYTIRTGDSVYVGSTTDFRRRKYEHKNCIYNENKNNHYLKLYQNIRNNDGDWDMQPFKIFPCNSKLELQIEEEKIRRELNADLNMIACQGHNPNEYHRKWRDDKKAKEYIKEYRENNKEKQKGYMKKYYEQNKDEINRKKREYYQRKRLEEKTKNENE